MCSGVTGWPQACTLECQVFAESLSAASHPVMTGEACRLAHFYVDSFCSNQLHVTLWVECYELQMSQLLDLILEILKIEEHSLLLLLRVSDLRVSILRRCSFFLPLAQEDMHLYLKYMSVSLWFTWQK